MGTNRTELEQILGILDQDEHVDVISMQLRPRPKDDPEREQLDEPVAALAAANARSSKPHIVLLHSPTPMAHGEAMHELDQELQALGIAAYPSYDRAARALAKVSAYYRWRAQVDARE